MTQILSDITDDVTSPPREELHAYLAPSKGSDAGNAFLAEAELAARMAELEQQFKSEAAKPTATRKKDTTKE